MARSMSMALNALACPHLQLLLRLLTMQSCALRLCGRSQPRGAPGPRPLLCEASLRDRRRRRRRCCGSAPGALLQLLGRMRGGVRTCRQALAMQVAPQRVRLLWKHSAAQILHADSCMTHS